MGRAGQRRRRKAPRPIAEHRSAAATQSRQVLFPPVWFLLPQIKTAASVPHPRVDEEIGEVGEQVERDVHRRGEEHDPLHDRIVAMNTA